MPETHPKTPDLRATLADHNLFVVEWMPWMAHGGPMGCLQRQAARATAVADLTIAATEASPEIIATLKAGSADALAEPLREWGETLGYRRLWLPGQVIDLDITRGPATYGTECQACHARWVDDSPEFWQCSVRAGRFPSFCWTCGCLLPQWRAWEQGPTDGYAVEAEPAGRS